MMQCPKCRSRRLMGTERAWRCLRCGFIHKETKQEVKNGTK